MAKQNDTGVYQKSNGYWEYRFRQKVNGKMVTHKKTTDAQGNKLKTKKEAVAAREEALVAARASSIDAAPTLTRRTVKQVFEEFCEHGRKDRAYQTIRKQDSLWENHLCPRFGTQHADEIIAAEVNDCLSKLHYAEGLAFIQAESLLRPIHIGTRIDTDNLEFKTISYLISVYIKPFKYNTLAYCLSVHYNTIYIEISFLTLYYGGILMKHVRMVLLLTTIMVLGIVSAYAQDNIVLPQQLRTIDEQAFYQSTSINSVSLPEGILTIGREAFAQSSLQSINLPASLTYIADNAFDDCTNLRVEAIPGSYAFNWAISAGLIKQENLIEHITLNSNDIHAKIGMKLHLKAEIAPSSASDIQLLWTSSNPSIASVSADGIVATHAKGTSVITAAASDGSGVSASCTITVSSENSSSAPAWGPYRIDYTNETLTLFLTWPYVSADAYDICRSDETGTITQFDPIVPYGTGSQGISDKTMALGKTYSYKLQLVNTLNGVTVEEGFNDPLTIRIKNIYAGKSKTSASGDIYENISVYSSMPWHLESIPDWLQISPTSGSSGKTTVNVYAKLNNTSADRSGYVYFTSGEDLAAVRIDQSALPFSQISLTAKPHGTLAQVNLSWTSADGADGYLVYRSTQPNGPYTQIAETSSLSYIDKQVNLGSVYYYKVLEYADEFDHTRTIGYDYNEYKKVTTASSIAVPTSIKLDVDPQDYAGMWIGDISYPIEVVITPSNVDNDTIYWTSSDESVATVDSEGVVYAMGVGSATITATTANGLSASCPVSVVRGYPQPAASAEAIGCLTIRLYWEPIDGAEKYNIYSSTKKLLGSTTDWQYITTAGTSPGSQTKYYVTAIYEDGTESGYNSASAVTWSKPGKPIVTVSKAASSYVTLNWTAPESADHYYVARYSSATQETPDLWQKVLTTTFTDTTVSAGKTYYYEVNACVWDSVSNASELVSVTTPGSTTQVLPTGITLDRSEMSINNDIKTLQLTATISPSNATNKSVTWISSDNDIATVDANGVITIHTNYAETVTITAKTSNGHTAKCQISINDTVEIHTQYGSGIYVPEIKTKLTKKTYLLHVGESTPIEGTVSIPSGIDRVTIKIDGHHPDGINGQNRYASKTFSGETSINLSNHDVFTLDANRAPLNVPGEYTMRLWGSDVKGNYDTSDDAVATIVVVPKTTSEPAEPTVYVTIGDKQYFDGDYIGQFYSHDEIQIWSVAHFTNAQRAWFRILYPNNANISGIVKQYSCDLTTTDKEWYPKLSDGASTLPAGTYEYKIDALNSSTPNDLTAPRTTITLKFDIKEPSESTYTIPTLGTTIDYALGEFFTTDHKFHGNDKSYDQWYNNAYECWGFALYVMDQIHPQDTQRYKLYYSTWDDDIIKNAILAAGKGSHIRTNKSGHSYVITDLNASNFSIIQANGTATGDYSDYDFTQNRNSEWYGKKLRNVINAGTWSWSNYLSTNTYGSRGIYFTEIWAISEKDAVIRSVSNLIKYGSMTSSEAISFLSSNVANASIKKYTAAQWASIQQAAEQY